MGDKNDLLGSILMDAKPGRPGPPRLPMGRIPKKSQAVTTTSSSTSQEPIGDDRKRRTDSTSNLAGSMKKCSTKDESFMKDMDWTKVSTNVFPIDVKNAPKVVDRLHIDFTVVNLKTNKEYLISGEKKGCGDISETRRKRGLWAIFQCFLKVNKDWFTNGGKLACTVAYDCGSAVYTLEDAVPLNVGESKTFILEEHQLTDECNVVMGRILQKVIVTVQKDAKVPMNVVDEVDQNEAQRFLDVLTSQYMYDRGYLCFNKKFFKEESSRKRFERECKEIKIGSEKHVKFIGTRENPTPALVLDVKSGAFYSGMPLIEYLCKSLNCDVRDIGRSLKKNERVLDETKTMVVETTYLAANGKQERYFFIKGFEFKGSSLTFKTEDGEISVGSHFEKCHMLRLRHHDLPLVVRNGKTPSYFPMELLRVVPGQRVHQANVPTIMQRDLVLALKPQDRVREYEMIRRELKLDTSHSNKYFEHFGVTIKPDMKLVDAIRISPPSIVCGKNYRELPPFMPGKEPAFRPRGNYSFFRPAVIDLVYVLFIELDGQRLSIDEKKFIENITQGCRDRGIDIRTIKSGSAKTISEIELKVEELGKGKERVRTLILGITNDKKDDAHACLKLYEARYSVQTLHLCSNTAMKIAGKCSGTTLDNVIRKLNVKCSGLNFLIEVPRNVSNSEVVKRANVDLNKLLFDDVMTVGIEMSHARAQCLFDRQHNVAVGEPSVVGMAFSYEKSTDHGGFFWLQKPREMSILCLETKFPEAVRKYRANTGRLPKKIFIYRSSSGDGAIDMIREEIDIIRKSLKDIAPEYSPKIVAFVVQASSSFRFFIENGRDYRQVDSGTCILSDITNMFLKEFILVSQHGRLGTSNPARYVIVANDLDWTTKDLAYITYWKCFGHPVSFSATSAPDVIFGAEYNAKRGRNNFLANRREQHLSKVDKSELLPLEDEKNAFDKITEGISNLTFGHNYWA